MKNRNNKLGKITLIGLAFVMLISFSFMTAAASSPVNLCIGDKGEQLAINTGSGAFTFSGGGSTVTGTATLVNDGGCLVSFSDTAGTFKLSGFFNQPDTAGCGNAANFAAKLNGVEYNVASNATVCSSNE
jgi:hypothetical protein